MLGVYKMSLFDLTGKSILITGSSKGIGKSIATRYAEYGAKLLSHLELLKPVLLLQMK